MAGKIPLAVEMKLGDTWVDITADVRTPGQKIAISRGRKNEGNKTDPSKCSLLLNNRHGKYSPRNPSSPYYGRIGRNTPLRVRVGEAPVAPSPDLADTFTRTVADGWGTSDSGAVWTTVAEDTGTISVDGSVGVHEHTSLGGAANLAVSTPLSLADFDLRFSFRVDTTPVGEADEGHIVQPRWRSSDTSFADGYYCFIEVGASAGRPDGGLALLSQIAARVPDGPNVAASDLVNAPGVVVRPGDWVNVRLRVNGPHSYVRFWMEGEEEPEVWHNQGWDDTYLDAGLLGLMTATDAVGTAMPTTFEFDDLSVSSVAEEDIATRFVGEVSEWPLRWDLSGNDVWIPLHAAGIMRRLDQGAAPLGSAMSYMIPTYLPLGYWPLEEGLRGDVYAASGLEGGEPARVQGLDFGENDLLLGSRPLPEVAGATERGHILTPPVDMADTGTWEASQMIYVAEDDYPEAETEVMRVSSTGTAAEWQILLHNTSDYAIRLRAFDADGATLVNTSIFSVSGVSIPLIDTWRQLRLTVRDDGSDVAWRLDWLNGSGAWWGWGDSFTGDAGKVLAFTTDFGDEATGIAIGHLSLWGHPGTAAYYRDSIAFAHDGDYARNRLARIAVQAGVPVTVIGRAQTLLGPQPFDASFLDICRETAAADGGILYEARDRLGLIYRGRDTLYNRGRPEGGDEGS